MNTKRNLFKKLGNTLINEGEKMLRRAFDVKAKVTTKPIVIQLLKSKGVNVMYSPDHLHFYLDIDKVKDIIKYDLTDEMKYLSEKFDCDDFADVISASFKKIYHINTVSVAKHIRMVDVETGKFLNMHRANVIVGEKNGEMGLFFLEPQTDKIIEIEKDKKYNFYGKYYLLNVVEF